MESSQLKVSARARVLGSFTVLYTVLLGVVPLVTIMGSYCLAQTETLKDLQIHAMLLGVLVLPLVGMICVGVFNRALGAWYARKGRPLMLVEALLGLAVHIGLILLTIQCAKW